MICFLFQVDGTPQQSATPAKESSATKKSGGKSKKKRLNLSMTSNVMCSIPDLDRSMQVGTRGHHFN